MNEVKFEPSTVTDDGIDDTPSIAMLDSLPKFSGVYPKCSTDDVRLPFTRIGGQSTLLKTISQISASHQSTSTVRMFAPLSC